MTQNSPASLVFNGRKYKTRLPTPTNKTVLVYDKEVKRNDKISKQMMKQRADSKQHVKKSEIKVGDKVLCRQQRLKKHTPAYSNEILRVIKRKGSLIVAKGETRTITRHVTLFKRLPHDLDADTLTPTPDQATPALAEVMTPPPPNAAHARTS